MKKIFSAHKVLFLTIILIGLLMPLTNQAFAQKKLDFDFNYVRFRGNETLSMVEVYYQIPLEQIEYVLDGEQYKLGFQIDLKISSGDSIYLNQSLKYPFYSPTDTSSTRSKLIPVTQKFFIDNGEYELVTRVSDLYGDGAREIKMPLNIPTTSADLLKFSDVLLSNSISADTIKGDFYKNGYKVLPNIAKIYGPTAPMLFFYTELYNIAFSDDSKDSNYLIRRRIRDSQNQIVKELPEKTKKKPGSSSVEMGRFNVLSLFTGQYILEVEATDLATKQTCIVSQPFFVYNPRKMVNTAETNITANTRNGLNPDSRYDIMVEEELDSEFDIVKYIATRDEMKTYKKLEITAKRNFLKEFWGRRDDNPTTTFNEFRGDYMSRTKYANENFGSMKDGWKTDRGRVLLIYGLPDEIERSQFTSSTKPYQFWRYFSVEGGVEFVFVDKRNFGNFELVHSTARGEIYDADWTRWVSDSSQSNSYNGY